MQGHVLETAQLWEPTRSKGAERRLGAVDQRTCHVITYKHFLSAGINMGMRTISSREFTRDIAGAKRAADQGPVFITDRGEPSYALLKIDDYYRLAGQAECPCST